MLSTLEYTMGSRGALETRVFTCECKRLLCFRRFFDARSLNVPPIGKIDNSLIKHPISRNPPNVRSIAAPELNPIKSIVLINILIMFSRDFYC